MPELPADRLRRWRESPVQMVRELFQVEPDAWQIEALEAFPHTPRLAMRACAGPGKTATLAWIGWNFLLTRPHPMVGAASINSVNLKSNLWAEFARWRQRSQMLMQTFTQTDKAIFANDFPQTWRIEARSWSHDADATQIGNALAGLHAKHVMWLLDETGDYPESVLPVCEGIFNGDPVEAHIVQAGNPTRRAGPLWRASSIARNLWKLITITADPDDPNRTPRVSIEVARQQIQQYGRENPWVKVRIFGEFPESDFNALIGPDEVEAAMRRVYGEYDIQNSAMVLGVDVAREGDDMSVVFGRRGLQAFAPKEYRNINSIQGAGAVARIWQNMHADACFVDATGGFGAGWIDQLIEMKYKPIGIHFSAQAHQMARYFNKRTEMYFDLVDWIKRGGALPNVPQIVTALTQTTYSFNKDRLLLEPKEIVKAKIGFSPDHADALALTFAEPVIPAAQQPIIPVPQRPQVFEPFRELDQRSQVGNAGGNYNPFGDR